MEIEKKLNEMGFQVPGVPGAAGNYIGCVRVGNTGRVNGKRKFEGKVGEAVTLEQAYIMARECALNHLAVIKEALGDLDRVERIVKVLAYINVAPGFTELPKVANGESDLLVNLWGDRGRHTRAAIGVAALGSNAAVETEIIVQVRE